MRRLLLVLLCCAAVLSCKDEVELTQMEIAEYASGYQHDWIVALDDRYDKWFRSYSATVLEDTRGDDVEGAPAVMGHDGNFLMIVDGEIRIFDAATGMDAGRIVPEDGGRYVCMDMDTLSGMLYALDSVHSRIDCVSSSGGLTGSVQLEGGHVYDRAVLIDEGTLLVLASGFSGRETFLVDLAGGRVSALDVPTDDVVKLSESVMDSLRSMGLPLWTVGRTRDGDVLVKHLFEDIVYRYDRSGSTPMYQVADAGGIKCSERGLRLKGKRQTWLTGMWQLGNGLWILRYKEYWKGLRLSAYAICNSDMTLYNNTIAYNSSRMWWTAPGLNVYDIRPQDIITVGPGGHRIYRLKAYNKSVHIPPLMQDDLGRGEVILCVFDLK